MLLVVIGLETTGDDRADIGQHSPDRQTVISLSGNQIVEVALGDLLFRCRGNRVR